MKIAEQWKSFTDSSFIKGVVGGILFFLMLPALATINAYQFENPQQEQRFRNLTEELRCPKCQNQSIADSNAPLSADLRQRVYEMIKDGRSNDEIIHFLVARYGDFITYRPPLEPMTWVLWFGPLGVVLVVFLALVLWIRKHGRRAEPELSEQERQRLQAVLDSSEESR